MMSKQDGGKGMLEGGSLVFVSAARHFAKNQNEVAKSTCRFVA